MNNEELDNAFGSYMADIASGQLPEITLEKRLVKIESAIEEMKIKIGALKHLVLEMKESIK